MQCYALDVHRMTSPPRTFSDFASWVTRPFGGIAMAAVGVAMGIVGLAMCVTIVMLPLGVTLGLIGIAVLLCSLFAPSVSTDA